MNTTNTFVSSIPAGLKSLTENIDIAAVLAARGMQNVSVSEAGADFGKNVFVAQAQALPKGTKFMIVGTTVVKGQDRNGTPLGKNGNGYDAVIILKENGETDIVSATNLFNAWLANADQLSAKQREQFDNHQDSLVELRRFYRENDNASITNSPVSGWDIQSSFASRFAKLSKGVITVADTAALPMTINTVERGPQPNTLRLFAFSADEKAASITAFEKAVTKAKK